MTLGVRGGTGRGTTVAVSRPDTVTFPALLERIPTCRPQHRVKVAISIENTASPPAGVVTTPMGVMKVKSLTLALTRAVLWTWM
jgi:hypothetical protein